MRKLFTILALGIGLAVPGCSGERELWAHGNIYPADADLKYLIQNKNLPYWTKEFELRLYSDEEKKYSAAIAREMSHECSDKIKKP